MKIGILSMQRIINNGSFLQAYALQEVLKNLGNCEVELIDFENGIVIKQESENRKKAFIQLLRGIKHTILPKYWSYMKTIRYEKRFRRKWAEGLPALGMLKEMNFPQGKKYDLVVIGSDEVFNICQFSNEGADIPWSLLGEEIDTKRLVSYAAACGQTSIDEIRAIGAEQRCGDLLKRFDTISVRDENTYQVVKTLSGAVPYYHIDPVLLAPDFPKDKSYRKLPYRYILIYAYTLRMNSEEEAQTIQAYARKHGLKTVCVNCFQTWCDSFIVASPFSLLQYVQDASYVVSDTFHGTVFSVRCNVPFAVIVRKSNSNKLRFLLQQFDLGDREVERINSLEAVLQRPIDFSLVNMKLEKERRKAIEYLREQIESVEDSTCGV